MNKLERFEAAVGEMVSALNDLPLDVAADAEDHLLVLLEVALDRRARKRADRWAQDLEKERKLS